MRLSAVLAVARRDLRMELRGSRGLFFGALTAALLLPVSSVPVGGSSRIQLPVVKEPEIRMDGEIPPGIDATVVLDPKANTRVEKTADGTYLVRGPIPGPLRHALDKQDHRPITIKVAVSEPPLPGRTLFLALISSSIMMGALSESLAGERARRTLSTLLAAAISREEIVAGKWLAWTGYGAVASMLAALVAIYGGAVPAGLWLLPLPVVPAATVALGLFLVRRARDVVAGATISLRVLPAALMTLGIAAWFLGRTHPLLGACVPLGGALLAAGDAWPGIAPPLVATLVTALGAWVLLAFTARDLDDDLGSESHGSPRRELLVLATIALAAWWSPVLGPLLWGVAGNSTLTGSLSPATGALAGGVCLTLLGGLRVFRNGLEDASMGRPTGAPSIVLASATILGASTAGFAALPPIEALGGTQARMAAALDADALGIIFAVALGQEWVFRGLVQRAVGPLPALAAFVLIVTPHDPLYGIVLGLPLTLLTAATRSVWPAVVARCLALSLGGMLAGLPAGLALGASLVASAFVWQASRPSQ
jgi:hypothetical protein